MRACQARSIVLATLSLAALAACGDESDPASAATSSAAAGGDGGAPSAGGGGQAEGGAAGSGGSGGAPVPQNQFLYVANLGSDTVSAYAIDDDGALAFIADVSVSGGPGPLAVDPAEERLYVASVAGAELRAFAIDAATGALTAIGSPTAIDVGPVYITVDRAGGYLLLASYGDDAARSYPILPDGTVGATPVSSLTPGTNPHSILTDRSNQFAFVPNTNDSPDNTIALYTFAAATGVLAPNASGAELVVGPQIGPRHMALHPSLDLLYVVNEHADSVSRYGLDPLTGLLDPLDTHSTLPGGVPDADNTCADIHVLPDGSALYASNRGDDSIAMFALDGEGALSSLGHVPTEPRPREFELSRDGRFVYVAGQDSDMLAAYAVDGGALSALDVYPVGDEPTWVLAVSVDAP